MNLVRCFFAALSLGDLFLLGVRFKVRPVCSVLLLVVDIDALDECMTLAKALASAVGVEPLTVLVLVDVIRFWPLLVDDEEDDLEVLRL